MQRGADIVIATPGRLLSQMNIYDIDFSGVKYFILDEADRMLDMGFYDDIMTVVKRLPKDRQTIMFSATMPPKIREMAKAIMHDPEEVQIAVSRPPETIHQQAVRLYDPQKTAMVVELLKGRNLKKVILFVGKKQKVRDLTRALRQQKIEARAMYSDLEQKERDEVMLDFRNGKVDVLVATDIVSRGIDVDDIPLVINYDVPRDVEDYVHRIGRTARAENSGESVTLVSPNDAQAFRRIEQFLKKTIDRIPLPESLGPAPTDAEYAARGSRSGSHGNGRGGHRGRSERSGRGGKGGHSKRGGSHRGK